MTKNKTIKWGGKGVGVDEIVGFDEKKIEELSEDPTRYKFLHYDLSGSCRVWIGKSRVIFSYDESKMELYLEKVVLGHKYRNK